MTYVPQAGYSVSTILTAAVADDGTFTVGYPTGTTQASFNAGQYKEGEGQVTVNGNDNWDDADPGIAVTTFGASTITLTNKTGASLAIGDEVVVWLPVWAGAPVHLSFQVDLAAITGAGDVVTSFRPGIAGAITFVQWVQNVAVTTAAKAASLNLEIGTTDVTGGVVALTSAAATPLGKVIAGTRVTAENVLEADDVLSVEASSVTAFSEGSGTLIVTIQPDVL